PSNPPGPLLIRPPPVTPPRVPPTPPTARPTVPPTGAPTPPTVLPTAPATPLTRPPPGRAEMGFAIRDAATEQTNKREKRVMASLPIALLADETHDWARFIPMRTNEFFGRVQIGACCA